MGTVVALGTSRELQGFVLAGAQVVAVSDDGLVDAWRHLDDDVGLVILTETAAGLLAHALTDRPDLLTAVLP